MATWFECKARYPKLLQDGAVKKLTEAYMVDALSVTEAEARITEELAPYAKGDFNVRSVKSSPVSEIFMIDGAEKWYLVKVGFIEIDEKSAKEKRTVSQVLVGGNDFKEAYDNFTDGMKATMADYEIVSIAETKIVDVFRYPLGEKKDA